MPEYLIYILSAICGFLISGLNPAIIFSKAVYGKDIRECGSKNPGFTNFKRCFGSKLAYFVFVLDLLKAAIPVVLFALLFAKHGISYQFGAAYTGVFCMLGHAYPVWYGFKGGKGFLVCTAVLVAIDWKVGIIIFAGAMALLFITKYMSFSTVTAMLCAPAVFAVMGSTLKVVLLVLFCAVFMAVRHKENIKRLINGTESKFYFKSKK